MCWWKFPLPTASRNEPAHDQCPLLINLSCLINANLTLSAQQDTDLIADPLACGCNSVIGHGCLRLEL